MLSANGLKLAIVSVTPTATWPLARALGAPRPSTAAPVRDAIKMDRSLRDLVCILLSHRPRPVILRCPRITHGHFNLHRNARASKDDGHDAGRHPSRLLRPIARRRRA